MDNHWLSVLLMAVAFVVTTIAYPFVLAFARKHGIVDNPSVRKLQRVPVPVMGGTAVFIGVLTAVIVGWFLISSERVMMLTALLAVMYAIGVWDDIKDVSAEFRFIVELFVVWMMILLLGVEMNHFHGFLGINEIPDAVSVPLSLIAGVGIMNAINMIDGVDGYCSTYGMMACAVFAAIFWKAGAVPMFALALIMIGALLPFFFHNVFGKTSKMFLGDGGSLMLGTLLAFFTFNTLTAGRPSDLAFEETGLSLVALCLAVLAIPVFDTLKVMVIRLFRGQSPFHPDKSHLHHLYIEMNFSHMATSAIIVLHNILIVGLLLLSWWLGADATLQTLIVIASALLYTWGFYFFMEGQRRMNDGEGTALWKRWCVHGINFTTLPLSVFIRKIVDSKFLGGDSWLSQPQNKIDPRVGNPTPKVKRAKDAVSRIAEEE